jgi:hypothetical protein
MSWVITGTQKTLNGTLTLGQSVEGGYFAGYISHTADGNPTHALIVAPKATGATGGSYTLTTNLALKTENTNTTGATSTFDGVINTAAMTASLELKDAHPAAKFCVDLNIGGYTDWYLPASLELAIAYVNLKPTTGNNDTFSGINAYAVPPRAANYTAQNPAITPVSLFAGGTEAFVNQSHWSSTPASSTNGIRLNFFDGFIGDGGSKTSTFRVRAFRRIAL